MTTSALSSSPPAALAKIALVKRPSRPPPSGIRVLEAEPNREPSREPSPFIKWVGGKGKLLSQLAPLLPSGVDGMRHVEAFSGGPAMCLWHTPQPAVLADFNPSLVDTYLAVRDEVESVIGELEGLSMQHAAGSYYGIRDRYNGSPRSPQTRSARAAMFIYLNKTCFNGLHRVNRRGEFNVPEGRYKNPRILD